MENGKPLGQQLVNVRALGSLIRDIALMVQFLIIIVLTIVNWYQRGAIYEMKSDLNLMRGNIETLTKTVRTKTEAISDISNLDKRIEILEERLDNQRGMMVLMKENFDDMHKELEEHRSLSNYDPEGRRYRNRNNK